MDIIIRKPTKEEKLQMLQMPVWSCEVSKFDWHYDSEETCLLMEGSVTVSYNGKSVNIAAGDYVTFPKGLSCVWDVVVAVKKHYVFG